MGKVVKFEVTAKFSGYMTRYFDRSDFLCWQHVLPFASVRQSIRWKFLGQFNDTSTCICSCDYYASEFYHIWFDMNDVLDQWLSHRDWRPCARSTWSGSSILYLSSSQRGIELFSRRCKSINVEITIMGTKLEIEWRNFRRNFTWKEFTGTMLTTLWETKRNR